VHAQLVRSRTTHQKRTEMHRIVADELIPALRDDFAGALSLVNPRTGEGMMIVLWQSAEQAQRTLGDNGTSALAPLLRLAGTSTRDHEPTTVWEVTLRV
jgi:hypothetical protein